LTLHWIDTQRMSGFFQPVINFGREFIVDARSSRRFQVALVLWLPLIIVGAILTVRFGLLNAIMKTFHEWKTTYVAQSQVPFPDLLFHMKNPNVPPFPGVPPYLPVCQQYGQLNNNPLTAQSVPINMVQCPWGFDVNCYRFNFSVFSSSGTDNWNSAINCTMYFLASQGNDVMRIHVPGGMATFPGTNWDVNDHPVRPNRHVLVDLEPEHWFPMQGPPVHTWRIRSHYESTHFTSYDNYSQSFSGGSYFIYNATLVFRIPYSMVRASWETTGFDGWFLLSAWGGGFYFLYVLHTLVFSILKLWLPNDSKLLPASGNPQGEYTPLK